MNWPYRLATIAYCAVLFWLSSMPEPPQPSVDFPGKDKIAHFVLYAGLAAIVAIGMKRSKQPGCGYALWWAPILFATMYGVTDEIHQIFVPKRSFDLLDIIADSAGAVVAATSLYLGVWRFPFRRASLKEID